MTQSERSSGEAMPNRFRLNGWKEISAYLNKSVRTVQRWEKELSLPIHRIHTAGGEIVFALQEEIERWLHEKGGSGGQKQGGVGWTSSPSADPFVLPNGRAFPWRRLWSAITLLSATSALAIWWVQFARDVQPSFARVEAGKLRVYNAGEHLLWEHRFDKALADDLNGQKPAHADQRLAVADLDGDGAREVCVIAHWESNDFPALLVINYDGRIRFSHQLAKTVQFGADRYAPPWNSSRFLLTDEPDGSKTIWLVSLHNLWFPAVIEKITPQGRVLADYWSNGHIGYIQEGMYHGRRSLLVGATNNERWAASLAVLDYEQLLGAAPAENPKYACSNCPRGSPLAFLVFPRMELSRQTDARPMVSSIRSDGSGRWILGVDQSHGPGTSVERRIGAAFYSFLPEVLDFEAETGDMYRVLHSEFEDLGRIHHRFGPHCESQLFPIFRWDGKKQRFIETNGRLANPPVAEAQRALIQPTN